MKGKRLLSITVPLPSAVSLVLCTGPRGPERGDDLGILDPRSRNLRVGRI
jgi:hypothetical protein